MPRLSASSLVLDDRHRNAGIGEVHRDAAAHRAGADHRRALDLARGDVLADARHLGGLALGKEDMALRLRLVADHELHEQVALFLLRLVDRRIERHADRFDRGGRRVQAARLLGVLRDDLVEFRRIGADLFELVVAILHALERALRRQHAARKLDRAGNQIALDDLVHQPGRKRVLRRDRIARQDHRQRLLDADQARQALRAAGARDETELDFGQARAACPPRRRGNGNPSSARARRRAACRELPRWSASSPRRAPRSRRSGSATAAACRIP